MRDGHRVDVDVHHPGIGYQGLGHLVHAAHGRDTGAEVEELPDAGADAEPDRPPQQA